MIFGSTNNRVGGQTPGERNIISGNGQYGVFIQGNSDLPVSSNYIQGNYIGLTENGSEALANSAGVWLMDENDSNVIGVNGTGGGGNVISGNSTIGVVVLQGENNILSGNIVGLNAEGSAAVPNLNGIEITGSSGKVGGMNSDERNVISGNTNFGLYLNEAADIAVESNYIGLDSSGENAVEGQSLGLRISGGTGHKILNNTISGNESNGIRIDDSGTSQLGGEQIQISGNMIGTDPNGEAPIGNVGSGILLVGSSNNTIGGELETEKNIISGNGGVFENFFVRSNGIYLTSESNNNLINGNYIGTNRVGEFVQVLGNSSNGILINEGSSGNTIGVDQNGAGASNIIVANGINTGANGITVVDDNSLNNRVSGNSVFSNGGIGIDLGDDGITENDDGDSDDGPNLLQNYPSITSALYDQTTEELIVEYLVLTDAESSYPLTIEFYVNEGNRQGKNFLRTASYEFSNAGSVRDLKIPITDSELLSIGDEITSVAISSSGNTSEFSAPFTVTENQTIPSVVTLLSPANEATEVSVMPVMSWESVGDATSYDLQVSTASNFSSNSTVVDMTDLTLTNTEIGPLTYATPYFWRVRSANDAGTGEWSVVWSFTTKAEPLSPPEAVTLESPSDEAIDLAIIPVLSWESAAGAESYDLQVSTETNFMNIVADISDLTLLNTEVGPLAYDREHHWRVRAVNEAGAGEWSARWSFTTEAEPLSPPEAVELLSPANQSQDVGLDPLLEWEESMTADSYTIELSKEDDQFTNLVADAENITALSYQVENLEGLTEYFWRVKAVNADGESSWSQPWSFTTMEATSISDESVGLPKSLELAQNYPNPFNPSTQIELALPEAGDVKLQVFDMLGRQVGTIVDQRLPAGRYSFSFDASYLTSGTYIYRINTGSEIRIRKMTLIK